MENRRRGKATAPAGGSAGAVSRPGPGGESRIRIRRRSSSGDGGRTRPCRSPVTAYRARAATVVPGGRSGTFGEGDTHAMRVTNLIRNVTTAFCILVREWSDEALFKWGEEA
ncbi:hypothetical protein GCM10027294_08920 [Marinactinospora endophytica]